ncbi:hypothetical protein [Acidipila sp. EB88]|uniref:hypothetical protein n=1 Tax=Acidipila sp. EB88 TaxID=2305226 RepID=UPI000F5F25E8|nr:hypothetical protein [Acidipila sp. EB88]
METEPELLTHPAAAEPVLPTAPVAEPASPGAGPATAPAATLFAGITGVADIDLVRAHAASLAAAMQGTHVTLAYAGADTTRTAITPELDLLSYPLPTAEATGTPASPWAQTAAAQAALLALASDSSAQSVVLLHPDLAALEPSALLQLTAPVLTREADLVMASYAQGPFDGLLNHSILAPLTRALYGKHVRFPLAPDFALSSRMAARLRMRAHSGGSTGTSVLWPTTVAAAMDATVAEVRLGLQHPTPSGDLDLATVIAQLVGSTFGEMELHAPLWQRVRAAQHSVPFSQFAAPVAAPLSSETVDTAPMIKSFVLGSRSLQDVWGMILPPVTLLDLKRITLLPAERFRLPDELWVRIIYDFALGYRLRTINRTHLLGALTPLYLGWVASYIQEASADPAFQAEARAERLARAFEDGKPYLVRRWRWPDRFNP